MKCKIEGAGRNESGFLDFYCKYCHEICEEDEDGIRECKYQENETTDSLYTLLNKKDKLLKELKQIVIEDVPHQYQERLLDLLNK